MIQFKSGDSFSLLIVLNEGYNVANLQRVTLFIETIGTGFMATPTDSERVFRVELDSLLTKKLRSTYTAQVEVRDALLGFKRSEAFKMQGGNGVGTPFESATNSGSDATVNVTINNEGVTVDLLLASVFRGFSAYEIAVRNGFEGTEAEYAFQNSLLFVLNITNKGNGDAITHNQGTLARVLTFYDDNDNGRQRSDFYASNATTGGFTLSNDFTNDKYTGTLLCVKY